MKILVSAYACNPLATPESHPGEAWDGWNQVKQMLRFHDLTVITWQYNERVLEDKVKKDKIENLKFYYLELPKIFQLFKKNYFGMRIYFWLWQVSAFSLAIRLHRKFEFDVFHHVTFHNDWMPSYIGAYLGLPFMWGPLGGGQKVPENFGKELSLKDRLNEIARVILQEFWRHTPTRIKGMKKAKAVLVCNEETKSKVEKFTKNIFDFPVNGISMDELIPIRELTHQPTKGSSSPNPQTLNTKPFPGSSSPKFKVLYAGRFDPIKAVPLAVRTFAEFNKKHPDSIFEIIGDGPEKGRIEKEIEKSNIPESVNLISWLPREELIKRMREADVFIFPSLRDGGGAVVVEAMASGLPVICLDLAGPGFHIQDKWGIKIEAKNPEYVVIEMAKALEKLYLDNNLRKQMGINARNRAEEYYLWDHLGERLQGIYEEALHIRG